MDTFLYSVKSASAIIISHDRLRSCTDTGYRHLRHFPDRVDNSHNTYINIPSHILKGGVTHHLHQGIRHSHGKTAGSQSQYTAYPLFLQGHIFFLQPDYRPFSQKKTKGPDRRNKLGDHCSHRSSPHSHMKPVNKNRVQHNIKSCPNDDSKHSCGTKSLGTYKLV